MFWYSGLPSMDFCSFFDTPWFGELHKKDLKLRPFQHMMFHHLSNMFQWCVRHEEELLRSIDWRVLCRASSSPPGYCLLWIPRSPGNPGSSASDRARCTWISSLGSVRAKIHPDIFFWTWPVDVLNMFTRDFLSLSVQMMFLSNFQGHSSINFFCSPRWGFQKWGVIP